MPDSVQQLVWLSQTLSPSLAWHAYSAFGSADAVYRAEPEDFQGKAFLKAAHRHFLSNKALEPAEQILSDCDRLGISVVTFADPAYPPLLREIAAPPLVLYYRGTLPDFDNSFLVAMAGTRRCSNYGARIAARLGRVFTENGLTVVTGMAQGCDQAALLAALDAGGPVCALVVGGLDQPFYPTDECRALYDRTAEHGFLLSEYAPGTPPHHGLFRMRNRLLSGIAHCLICVEGGRTSGAMQVADYAAEQGREIFAVPGRLDTPSAIGTNELIQSGVATLLLHPNDIFDLARRECPSILDGRPDALRADASAEEPASEEDDSPADAPTPAPNPSDSPAAAPEKAPEVTINLQETVDSRSNSAYSGVEPALAACSETERACFRAIPADGISADLLADQCGISPSEMNAALSSLLLLGLAEERSEGRFFQKSRESKS